MVLEKETITIPEPTLKRLPRYIDILRNLTGKGEEYVSSSFIASALDLDPIQVRKDLSITGIVGKPKLGFEVKELLQSLLNALNWNNKNEAFLVGAGSLGSALLGYKGFKEYGLEIVAAFDNDPKKIGKRIDGIKILPVGKLTEMAERMHIHLGIITAPAEAAQEIADMLIEGGVIGIWNFAPVHLKVPANIIVENAQLSQSLAVLTHKLSKASII
ncbi:CoA-binding domain protein [Melioribacter roseus P3M-2]|uniref:Redox-sensing transcriptional repressor Rex n=1 Tax=Melioribacter roseus (strain DSM 23840 / JCM 17771 / VKM B-2668 / P3M-2) TaxID=1191523 RepID=I6Z403_MELRP|nr:redox-sensing transcriptional repressor Rex [Melioribacter roseus]AFN73880.1 CoA-binding domain protein [Melioribacter roseus P3M-2]